MLRRIVEVALARKSHRRSAKRSDECCNILPIAETDDGLRIGVCANEKAPEFPGLSLECSQALIASTPRGAELSQESPGKSQVVGQGDSQSDSLGGVVDPQLARLIEVWPALADDVKGEMLTLAGLRR